MPWHGYREERCRIWVFSLIDATDRGQLPATIEDRRIGFVDAHQRSERPRGTRQPVGAGRRILGFFTLKDQGQRAVLAVDKTGRAVSNRVAVDWVID